MIPISYWKSVEGQYSEKSWDKPLYTNEPNSAPTDCDYFTESQSGNSWRVYKNRISNTFDLSAIKV